MPFPFSGGEILNASDMNQLSWGVVGYDRNTSPPTLTTSEQDIVSVTFTAQAGRLYLATAQLIGFNFNAAGALFLKIYAPSRISEGAIPAPSTSLDFCGCTVSGYFEATGSVTVDFRAQVLAGATSADVGTAGTSDPYLLVQDVGPA
jgi:hypothetical protein